jgi:hypothetical protein
MFSSSTPQPPQSDEVWKARIDQFTADHERELAALAWGFYSHDFDSTDTIGIDLKPRPQFVTCTREALDRLNRRVKFQLQEMLGIRDHFDPKTEVFIVVIGDGQLKLIYFESDPTPQSAWAQLGLSLDELSTQLEATLQQYFPD